MKQIEWDFCSDAYVIPKGRELGAPGILWKSKFFFEHGHVTYQIDGDIEWNRMQVKFSPYGQTGDLGVKLLGRISFNFNYKVNFKDFYTKAFVCSHKRKIRHIRHDFHSVTLVMP